MGLPELSFWGIVLATLFLVVGWFGKVLITAIVFLVEPSWFELRRGSLARADVPQLRRGRSARPARVAAARACARATGATRAELSRSQRGSHLASTT